MENENKTSDPAADLFQGSFVKNPHDKYARYSLQIREIALAFFQYALDEPMKALLDWETLTLTNDSYIDEELQGHFTDICYSGMTVAGHYFRISLLIEHKSEPPERGEITEQLGRYIFNGRRNDSKKGQPLTLTIPIVLYHGRKPLKAETPATIFPGAPKMLHRYVPSFDYVIVDLGATTDETLTALEFPPLRQFLLALKYSRNEKMLAHFWTNFLKFAEGINGQLLYVRFVVVTVRYLSANSKTILKKIHLMDNATASPEEKVFKSYLDDWFEEAKAKALREGMEQGMEKGIKKGMEKGIEKGIEKGLEKGMAQGLEKGMENTIRTFIVKNPTWTDRQIADCFDVTLSFVKKIRTAIK